MPVEIGSLTVRGTFGAAPSGDRDDRKLQAALARLRRELIAEMQELVAEAERRQRER
jgi:hypothetical protein